jgi:Holliday junction resolvasome RuvABC endonuclease subunit
MRVLSFDPGAKRLGWASLGRDEGRLYYHMSGLIPIPQKEDQKSQVYRQELIQTLAYYTPTLLDLTEPDEVAVEIVPSVGGGNFAAAVQTYMVHAAITTVETICYTAGLPIYYYGANTVQSRIAIRGRGKKITKVHVRNGVIQLFPELEERKSDWVKIFEEPDAIAVGATHLGAKN